jgi:hypothetical protein
VTGLRIALFEDLLAPGAPLRLAEGAVRIHWLRHGAARVNGATLAADAAATSEGATVIEGEGELWTFALSRAPAGFVPEERQRLVLAAPVPARDPAAPLLFRLDRVDFPPEGETPRHGHSGPGLRRLLSGSLLMEIGPRLHRAVPGQAWFEPGDEPVVARPLMPGSAFLRAMVLDPALRGGRSSFVAWTPEDAAKPRNAAYRLYAEVVVTLG